MELNIVVMKVSMVHILFPHSLFSSILVFLGPGLLISIPEFKKKLPLLLGICLCCSCPKFFVEQTKDK